MLQKGRPDCEHRIFGNPVADPPSAAHRLRVIILWVVATHAGLFFVVAVVLMASAPGVLLQPDPQTRTELNRWSSPCRSVDAIAAGMLLAHSRAKQHWRPGIRRIHPDLRHLVESAHESLWLCRGPRPSVGDSADCLGLEAVAHSRLGDEVAWPSRIVLELVSECLDVLTQIVGLLDVCRSPDLLK